ncbi:hypothetical protein AB0G79_05660 [Streptomyces sp. NPDC020807]|uniref:hypothetical protein n=1 Tax=Streptomyces sp. NPDC020807 TaxID=3155119 RepID=UPI0033F29B70
MNDTPGWTSPGSAPSDGQDGPGTSRPTPADADGSASQWSKDQPPAGQWSPPADRTPARSSSGPWGPPSPHSGRGAPQAAQPGVIPLRPLGVGEILDGSVKTLRTHWRTVLAIAIPVAVFTQVVSILVQRYLVPTTPALSPDATPAEQLEQAVQEAQNTLIGLGPEALLTLIATVISTALLSVVVSRAVMGRPVSLGDAWHEARPRLLPLLGLTLLLGVMSAGIIVVGVLPGILIGGGVGIALTTVGGLGAAIVTLWLMIRFNLASPALMLERQGVLTSLKRSAKLVQGSWWRIFGITLLTQLLVFVFAMIILIPFTIIGFAVDGGFGSVLSNSAADSGWPFLIVTGIGGVIISAITYPITAGVNVLLYVDQRIRREALDLELARAAGIPGYGTAPGTDTVGG